MYRYAVAATMIGGVLFGVGMPAYAVDPDSGITFGPYVQRMKKTAVTILLRTDSAVTVKLKYRKVGAENWKKVHDDETDQHRFRLTDLKKGTSYEYYIQDSNNSRLTPTYTFTTKRSVTEDAPLRIAVFGDSGVLGTDQFRVAGQMQSWRPDLFLHTGDIAYNSGTEEEYRTKVFDVYQSLFAEIPFYGSIGNHDYTTEQAGPYKELFEYPTAYSTSEDYYAFDYGPAHIVSLNTSLDYSEGSEQYNWLVSDLQASDKDWKIVYFHFPMYSAGEHGTTVGMADILGPVFEQYGVDLVLNGHDHDYERNNVVNGVLYVVTGGGGATLYEELRENPESVLFRSQYHFVGLTITKTAVIGKAIDERGYVFDEFSLAN